MASACSGTQGRVAESGESMNFGAYGDRSHRGSNQDQLLILWEWTKH